MDPAWEEGSTMALRVIFHIFMLFGEFVEFVPFFHQCTHEHGICAQTEWTREEEEDDEKMTGPLVQDGPGLDPEALQPLPGAKDPAVASWPAGLEDALQRIWSQVQVGPLFPSIDRLVA